VKTRHSRCVIDLAPGHRHRARRVARTPAFTMAVYQHVLPGMRAEAAGIFAVSSGSPTQYRATRLKIR
jgi:cytochrome P450